MNNEFEEYNLTDDNANNYSNENSSNEPTAAENFSNGNFSNDPTIAEEISSEKLNSNSGAESASQAPKVDPNDNSYLYTFSTGNYNQVRQNAYNAQTGASYQTYGAQYQRAQTAQAQQPQQTPQSQQYRQSQQTSGGSAYYNNTANPGTAYYTNYIPNQASNPNNNQNVKKITKKRMSGYSIAMTIIAAVLATIIVGIGIFSLLNVLPTSKSDSSIIDVIPDNPKTSENTENSGNNQSKTDDSPSKSESGSGYDKSDFFNYAVSDPDASALSTVEIAAKCMPSVVEIQTEYVVYGSWAREYVASGAGSGVIVTEDGYIITNHHVIEDAKTIMVTLTDGGKQYEAKLIGSDEKADIAVIKIEATGLIPAEIGNSDELVVGEKAVVIGNPLGTLGGTVTDGIISALDREITINGIKRHLLQTNAAINPGNSGGALFNGKGELVAVIDAKSQGTGIEGLGFAIPINTVTQVVDQIMEFGYVTGYTDTGMTFLEVNDYITAMQYRVNNFGVYVYRVIGDNALEAGFQSGDLIVSIDGEKVSTESEVKDILDEKKVGDTVTFKVYRNRNTIELKLTLSEYKPS